jgi:hypothetical protein
MNTVIAIIKQEISGRPKLNEYKVNQSKDKKVMKLNLNQTKKLITSTHTSGATTQLTSQYNPCTSASLHPARKPYQQA